MKNICFAGNYKKRINAVDKNGINSFGSLPINDVNHTSNYAYL